MRTSPYGMSAIKKGFRAIQSRLRGFVECIFRRHDNDFGLPFCLYFCKGFLKNAYTVERRYRGPTNLINLSISTDLILILFDKIFTLYKGQNSKVEVSSFCTSHLSGPVSAAGV